MSPLTSLLQGRALARRANGNPKMSKWAIRDIKHGKTYFFDSYEEMAAWIKSNQTKMT